MAECASYRAAPVRGAGRRDGAGPVPVVARLLSRCGESASPPPGGIQAEDSFNLPRPCRYTIPSARCAMPAGPGRNAAGLQRELKLASQHFKPLEALGLKPPPLDVLAQHT